MTILITNPRDLNQIIQPMKQYQPQMMTGLNTLYAGLLQHPELPNLDFSKLKMSLAGGMAMTTTVSKKWEEVTGCPVYEGYGLTETSPVLTLNPLSGNRPGSIGIPLPNTNMRIVNERGEPHLQIGSVGEI